MIQGSCLCGAVKYVYSGEFGTITICHCSDCRKAQGASGVAAAPAQRRQLRWTQGAELITEYESSAGKKRAFCRCCGAPLYSRRDDQPEILRLRMGSIDSALETAAAAHIFAGKLPPWAALDDALPRYERLEPGRGA